MTEENYTAEDIKKLAKSQKIIIGTEMTLKQLREGKLSKIFLAKNAKSETKEDFMKYAKLANVPFVQLDIENNELGTLCRKPFSISVLGQPKQ